jgi:hypothetical protein
MIAAVVLPQAVAWLVALCLAIAPITGAVGTLSSAASATDKIVTDAKADIAKLAKHKRHKTPAPAPARP